MTTEAAIPIITDEGLFNQNYERFCRAADSSSGETFVCISVFGPQSSGKSTLLNDVFGTDFKTMDMSAGRSQTTKGIMARAIQFKTLYTSRVLVLDCEGSDSRERNQQDTQNIERHIGCFSAAVSDLLVINTWNHDIGRHSAANYNTLSTIFNTFFNSLHKARTSSGNTRPLMLLIAIRDADEDGKETTQKTFESDVHRIFEESTAKQSHGPFSEYFDLSFWFIPHRKYMRAEYDKAVLQIREDIRGMCNALFSSEASPNLMSLVDSATYYTNIWTVVRNDKDLDIPSQREILSNVRCEEFYSEILQEFLSQVKKLSVDVAAAVHEALKLDGSTTVAGGLESVKDYPIAKLHNTCNSLKLTKILMNLAQDTIVLYQQKTKRYVHKIAEQWGSRMVTEIIAALREAVCPLVKGLREATIQALQTLSTPFCTQIVQWLEQRDYDDNHTSGGNEVDILVPELISSATLPRKKLTDLIGLLGATTRVFRKCTSHDWAVEYQALWDADILINLPRTERPLACPGAAADGTADTPSKNREDEDERLSIGGERTKPALEIPPKERCDILSEIKRREVYSPVLCMLLENICTTTYGQALLTIVDVDASKEYSEAVPETTNAYDAICLLHTVILLWYSETVLPLTMIYDIMPEVSHIVPESNSIFCNTMSCIQTAVSEAISVQARTLAASAAYTAARALNENLYAELGSLRGVIYISSKKSLERSLFSLLSSTFVDQDHQELLRLRSRLSDAPLFPQADPEAKSDFTLSTLGDSQSIVYQQYIGMCMTAPASILSPTSRTYGSKSTPVHPRSTQAGLPRYMVAPIVSAVNIVAFHIPQTTLLYFMEKIDADIISWITRGLNESLTKKVDSILQSRLEKRLLYDEQGEQRSYASEEDLEAEFVAVKKQLIDNVELFRGGSLITENLHPVSIKPVTKEKIAEVIQNAEAKWEETYQEVVSMHRSSKHKSRHRLAWIVLGVVAVLLRQLLYRIVINKYSIIILTLLGSPILFVHVRVAPEDRNTLLIAIANDMKIGNARGIWSSLKDLGKKAIS